MSNFGVHYTSSHGDDIAFALYLAAGHPLGRRRRFVSKLLQSVIILLILAALFYVGVSKEYVGEAVGGVIALIICCELIFFSPTFRLKSLANSLRSYMHSYPHRKHEYDRYVHFGPRGIRITTQYSHSAMSWEMFKDVDIWRDHLFIYNGVFGYVSIPLTACPSKEYALKICDFAKAQIAATKTQEK